MKDNFVYVLENYPNADLSKKEDRDMIADALANIMCEHHIISYTDLDAVKKESKILSWINQCKNKKQTEIPFERGL